LDEMTSMIKTWRRRDHRESEHKPLVALDRARDSTGKCLTLATTNSLEPHAQILKEAVDQQAQVTITI
jgi:hypothetical protein